MRQAAELFGCAASNIMRIERGQKPGYDLACRIVQATGGSVSMDEIYRTAMRRKA